MPVIARFLRSDAMAERLGEREDIVFSNDEGFQLTYHELRSLPDGESLAHFDSGFDAWVVGRPDLADVKDVSFSDVVIAHA